MKVWTVSICRPASRSPKRPVKEQPSVPENSFLIGQSERVYQTYIHKAGTCGCGPTHTVTLTDARLIQRSKEYACCGTGARLDKMLFLSDVSGISDLVGAQKCCQSISLCSILCCPITCLCACCCQGSVGKDVGIRGTFGEYVFTFSAPDVSNALVDISSAVMPYKVARQQY